MKGFLKYFGRNTLVCILLFWGAWLVSASEPYFEAINVPGIDINVGRGAAAWADYNNDGSLDLLIIGEGTSKIAKIYTKNASGTSYRDTTSSAVPAGLPGVTLGTVNWIDYNNDGNLDFFITGTTGTSGVLPISKLYTNSGAPNYTFTEYTKSTFTGVNQSAVAWGDFNNDGRIDLALAGRTDANATLAAPGSTTLRTFVLYTNNSDGSFTDVTTTALGTVSTYILPSLVFADFDNDGYLDLLVGGYPNLNSVIYKNNGNGTFATAVNVGSTKWRNYKVAVADYDLDGYLDIVGIGYDANSYGNIHYYRNTGSLTFSDLTTTAGFSTASATKFLGLTDASLGAGDFNNDGYPDFVFLSDSISAASASLAVVSHVYINQKDNTFKVLDNTQLPIKSGVAARSGSARWIDYDNDGKLDISLSGSTSTSNYNSGSLTIFRNISSFKANTLPSKPSNLQATYNAASNVVTFTWDKASDNEQGSSLTYRLTVRRKIGQVVVVAPLTTSNNFYKVAESGSIYTNTYSLGGLRTGRHYWSVQAIDNAYAAGAWADEAQVVIGNDIEAPTIETSDVTVSNITSHSVKISSWTKGNGKKRAAFITDNASTSLSLIDEKAYTADPVFGSSQAENTGWYTVYNGDGDGSIDLTISKLTPGKTYTLSVIEYNTLDQGGAEHYLLTGVSNTITFSTLIAPPQIQASNTITLSNEAHAATLSWTNGDGAYRVAFLAQGTPAIPTIEDKTSFTVSQTFSDWTVVYNGTSNSVALTNLLPNKSYSFVVFEYNGKLGEESYLANDAVSYTFTTPKIAQQIVNFAAVTKQYGNAAFDLQAQSSVSAIYPISYSLISNSGSDASVVSLASSTVSIKHVGTIYIQANQAGNDTVALASPVSVALTVVQAPLNLAVVDTTIVQGSTLPSIYKVKFIGFAYNDNENVVSGSPVFSVSDFAKQSFGTFLVEPSIGSLQAANYYFDSLKIGKLIITEKSYADETGTNSLSQKILVYPNPLGSEPLIIETSEAFQNGVVRIENLKGTIVFEQQLNETRHELDLSRLPKGIYLVKISNRQAVFVKRIVKLE